MVLNSIALKKKMLEKQLQNKDVAEKLGISRSAVQRKLKGETEFSRVEINRLIHLLKLENKEVMEIFFDQ